MNEVNECNTPYRTEFIKIVNETNNQIANIRQSGLSAEEQNKLTEGLMMKHNEQIKDLQTRSFGNPEMMRNNSCKESFGEGFVPKMPTPPVLSPPEANIKPTEPKYIGDA